MAALIHRPKALKDLWCNLSLGLNSNLVIGAVPSQMYAIAAIDVMDKEKQKGSSQQLQPYIHEGR